MPARAEKNTEEGEICRLNIGGYADSGKRETMDLLNWEKNRNV